ncbi:hypothetical protein Ccrd_013273 [Cynara cardunculus var. scolymus]|uniref:Uncharacterized protein n=1 Tax=Cynara cardunculus var. scolymus TaxID=59895 RepID=A0A124SH42_CYNCS|nr:hypothetical protein Ccrd_013273 [Cynara cardunculus var. scolymus]
MNYNVQSGLATVLPGRSPFPTCTSIPVYSSPFIPSNLSQKPTSIPAAPPPPSNLNRNANANSPA